MITGLLRPAGDSRFRAVCLGEGAVAGSRRTGKCRLEASLSVITRRLSARRDPGFRRCLYGGFKTLEDGFRSPGNRSRITGLLRPAGGLLSFLYFNLTVWLLVAGFQFSGFFKTRRSLERVATSVTSVGDFRRREFRPHRAGDSVYCAPSAIGTVAARRQSLWRRFCQ